MARGACFLYGGQHTGIKDATSSLVQSTEYQRHLQEAMERRMTRWGGSDSSAHVSSLPRTKTFNTLQDTADPPSKPRLLSSNDGPTQLIPFMDKNPWQDHEQVASIVQAKKVYVSSCMQPKIKLGRLVAIRKIDQCPKEALKALQTARDENIVKCDQAYFWDESLYLVYELLPNAVTLSQVIVNPRGRLHGPEMATICLGLLKGIKYIHESLRMVHGDITKHTVLLSWHGQVKIGRSMCVCQAVGLLIMYSQSHRKDALCRDAAPTG